MNAYALRLSFALVFGISACAMGNTSANVPTEPLFTKSAQTYQSVTMNAYVKYFEGTRLQEVDNFDGWTTGLDLSWPLFASGQLRFIWPIYTDGEANRIPEFSNGFVSTRTDVEGFGGTFDFLTLLYEHQLIKQADKGFNLSLFGGGGVAKSGTALETDFKDRINHRGRALNLGARADKALQNGWRLFAELGATYYVRSDDINPSGSDIFSTLDLNGAVVFNPFYHIHPVLEVIYKTNYKGYDNAAIVPELMFTPHKNVDIKLGIPVKLTDDAEDFRAQLGISLRFM